MSNPERVSPKAPSVRDRRAASELTSRCSQCDVAVDPLRAARARILDDRFHYFCSAECAEAYEPREPATPHPAAPPGETRRRSEPSALMPTPSEDSRAPDAEMEDAGVHLPTGAPETRHLSPRRAWTTRGKQEPLGVSHVQATELPPSSPRPMTAEPPKSHEEQVHVAPTLLLQASVVAAALCILLLLALEGPTTNWVRLGFAALACALQVSFLAIHSRHARLPLDGADTASLVSLVVATFTVGLCGYALALDSTHDAGLISLAGTQQLLWGLAVLVTTNLEAPLETVRRGLAPALDRRVLRISGDTTVSASASELRPGEDIVVHAGEVLPVDASIVAGSGEANPWLNSDYVREVTNGDTMYAGAKLVSGQVRAVVRWTGNDRHWLRLTTDPQRRADLHAPSVRLVSRLLFRVAPGLVLLAAAVSWSQAHDAFTIWGYALSAASVLMGPVLPRIVRLEVLRATLNTLEHGIVLAHARVIEIAGKITRAVFCARGTLLLGEPQLSTLEPSGSLSSDEVLALVAGAEQSSSHPIASSVLRAARAAGILPDAVRNPRSEPGLGVTALAADGRTLVVGSRALMLRERVSVARAEARITELEATGRTVLLVALGGHLSAILSFQDGLRKGARAAVQHLLDAAIEPVLLSGDARETCEALAKTLDIEHVRPDVLPGDRGKEVERLRGGGAGVAVVGRSPVDDLPLASATLSIALPSQGLQAAGFDVDLAADEVQNASLALRILHEHRTRVQRSMWVFFGGGILAVFGGVALAIPAAWAPFVATCCLGVASLVASGRPGGGGGARDVANNQA